MKAEITKDGYVKIIAENFTEAFAIEHLVEKHQEQKTDILLIDCSIIAKLVE